MEDNRTKQYSDILESFEAESRLRSIPAALPDGMVDMTSNDYLGLAAGTRNEQYDMSQMTSSASRLLCGRQEAYDRLETHLSRLYGRPALLFNSGYHANTGCVSALATSKTVIIADRLVHASIIDGIRLSGARFMRFRHNDMTDCERFVAKAEADGLRPLVVTESIFSMDGDVADIRSLVEMRSRHPEMLLYVDEAHAFGVRGRRGLGVCEELGVMDKVDVIIGTFGKAAASMGAFAIASQIIHDYLLNTARSLIFSTALPPACFLHTDRMLTRITEAEELRNRLKRNSDRFRVGIESIAGRPLPSASQIVPLFIGDAARSVEIANSLAEEGINALPIRRPTVPPGTERIRFAVNARLSTSEIDNILSIIRKIYETEMGAEK